ncbi:MAG: amino acid ABC transporter substrate-binding protein [Desulfobulbaceae bacterium]|nr:amino acid ABC transporter substrate-binding protein [Desulfobulbaceae bacterium]
MTEAFSRIDVDVVLRHLDPEEALVNANKGKADGDAVRIGGLSKLYPNLLQVPAIALMTNLVAFSKNPEFKLTEWNDLIPHNVAIIKGHKISEKMVVGTRSLTRANDLESLFNLLKTNMVEVVVCELGFGTEMARKLNITEIIVSEPPLAKLNFFVYLHKKHEILIPGLTKAINEMHIDGSYNRIVDQKKSAVSPNTH